MFSSTTPQHCDISAPHAILFHAGATDTENETINHIKTSDLSPGILLIHTVRITIVLFTVICLLPDMLELLVNTPVNHQVVV